MRGVGRTWLIGTGLLYVPPLIEQVTHGVHGNIRELAKFAVAPPHHLGGPTGFAYAAGTLGGVLRWPPTGLGGSGESIGRFTGYLIPDPAWTALPIIVSIVAIYLLARRSRVRKVGDALLFAGVVFCAAFASASRVIGERWPYLFTWRFAVVWFVVGVAVVGASGLCQQRHPIAGAPRKRSRTTNLFRWCGLAAALIVLGIAVVAKSVSAPHGHILPFEPATERLANKVLATRRPDGVVEFVRFDRSVAGVADGVMNRLDEKGWRVGAPSELAYEYGDTHAISNHSASQIWFISETSVGTTLSGAVPGAHVLAMVTPLSKLEDRELAHLQRQLIARMRGTGHFELFPAVGYELGVLAVAHRMDTTGIDMGRLAELNAKVARSPVGRFAVTIVPVGTPSDPLSLAKQLPTNTVESWR